MEALRRPTKPRAITSKLGERVIGEVEVEQRGRQDGEDRSRRLGRRFRRTAVTPLGAWKRAAAAVAGFGSMLIDALVCVPHESACLNFFLSP